MNEREDDFKTHIKEPRWQQVLSIIVVIAIVGVWLWFALHRGA